jgi:hypothetical protein
MKRTIKRIIARLTRRLTPPSTETQDVLLGRLLALEHSRDERPVTRISDREFSVFSQFGDDGIIQHIVRAVDPPPESRTFIEFGVENYREANTRFLMVKDNWRGLVMDGSVANIESIRRNDWYWRYDLTAIAAWIDRENINELLATSGFAGPIGLLSIDLDGNDYWVWEAITVDALIVVVEYNSVLGSGLAVTVPYDQQFSRFTAHHSGLYFGASLKALVLLGERKGYVFIGSNSAGNNAYFVRHDLSSRFPNPTPDEGYVESAFRESRDLDGNLSFTGGSARRGLIGHLPVVNLESGRTVLIAES